jgi:hypothetical protein
MDDKTDQLKVDLVKTKTQKSKSKKDNLSAGSMQNDYNPKESITNPIELKDLFEDAKKWISQNPGKTIAIGVVGLISFRSRSLRKLAMLALTTWGTTYLTNNFDKEDTSYLH